MGRASWIVGVASSRTKDEAEDEAEDGSDGGPGDGASGPPSSTVKDPGRFSDHNP